MDLGSSVYQMPSTSSPFWDFLTFFLSTSGWLTSTGFPYPMDYQLSWEEKIFYPSWPKDSCPMSITWCCADTLPDNSWPLYCSHIRTSILLWQGLCLIGLIKVYRTPEISIPMKFPFSSFSEERGMLWWYFARQQLTIILFAHAHFNSVMTRFELKTPCNTWYFCIFNTWDHWKCEMFPYFLSAIVVNTAVFMVFYLCNQHDQRAVMPHFVNSKLYPRAIINK